MPHPESEAWRDVENQRRLDEAIPTARAENLTIVYDCFNKQEADDLRAFILRRHPDMRDRVRFTWLLFRE